ncbi:hypothetical protein LFM09_49475 [Lentzea alba]|uniref:hypothetical protein n=1 Tax=Lentzea alba TaxID=2714351 RepID=UPI0039BF77DC
MTWQQPVPSPGGGWSLSQVDHPCVNGCSGWFQMPAAESGGIVDPGSGIGTGGNVAQANQQLRTDWSQASRSMPGLLTELPPP